MKLLLTLSHTFLVASLILMQAPFSSSCEKGKADIMLVLDQSGSVGEHNFKKMKTFVQNVVTNLPVGPNSVHVGLIKYSKNVHEEFDLNKHMDSDSLENVIDKVDYDKGSTNTDKALDYLRERSFTANAGDRADAPNIVILITDGASNDKEKTKKAAERLKAAGVTVFSIGVNNADEKELTAIASKPSSEYVFFVKNFNGLDEIKGHILSDICNKVDPCEKQPCENFGKCIVNNTDYSCLCPEGFKGKHCSIDTNPCKISPCENGGKCFKRYSEYICVCPTEFEGKNCSDEIDPCRNKPCQNGGQCLKQGSQYICVCQSGFEGKDCTQPITPCKNNPCKNSGECFSKGSEYICVCPAGYEGKNCSEGVDPCESSPCKNGGTCSHDLNTFNCTCTVGFEGPDCSKVNPCASSPCQNGGTCFRNVEDFLCSCAEEYEGKDCSLDVDECRSNPCLNGGTCINGNKTFTCICINGFQGDNCSFACENMDLMFVLDESGSIKRENFKLMKQFVKNLTSSYAISNDGVHVGAITFSKEVTGEFDLKEYTDIDGVSKGIDGISYSNGPSTHTYKALSYLRTESFTNKAGDRKYVPNVAIVISDGISSNKLKTKEEAEKLKNMGVTIYAIGVGNADEDELKNIASSPSSNHQFSVKTFEDLKELKNILLRETCKEPDFCRSSPCKNGGTCFSNGTSFTCYCTEQFEGYDCSVDKYSLKLCGKADIVFALDYSESVGSSNFSIAKTFVKNLTASFNIGLNDVRTGAISFGRYVSYNFKLTTYSSVEKIHAAIDKIYYRKRAPTYIYKALNYLRTRMFTESYGNRIDVPDIAIIITDGIFRETSKAIKEAELLRNAGVTIYTIGVGNVKQDELEKIVSHPSSSHVLIVENYGQLEEIKKAMLSKICGTIKAQTG